MENIFLSIPWPNKDQDQLIKLCVSSIFNDSLDLQMGIGQQPKEDEEEFSAIKTKCRTRKLRSFHQMDGDASQSESQKKEQIYKIQERHAIETFGFIISHFEYN